MGEMGDGRWEMEPGRPDGRAGAQRTRERPRYQTRAAFQSALNCVCAGATALPSRTNTPISRLSRNDVDDMFRGCPSLARFFGGP